MHFDINSLILVGVAAQLVGSLAKTLFKKPQQQAQIDRIEAGINTTLAQVAPVLSALQTANNSSVAATTKGTLTKGTLPQ